MLVAGLGTGLLPEGYPEAALELGAIGENERRDLVDTGFEDRWTRHEPPPDQGQAVPLAD